MAIGRSFALLFADRIIREDNGKHACIGIFDQLSSPSAPFPSLSWFIFAGIEDVAKGTHTVTMNLVHDATQAVILPVTLEVEQMGDGQIVLAIPVLGLWMPQFGDYTLTQNLDGYQIGSRILKVVSIQPTAEPQGGPHE